MRNGFVYILIFLVAESAAFAQDITKQEADSMKKELRKNDHGISRITNLLNLAQFHIFKPGESEIDFDSARICINEAKQLNEKLRSVAVDGYTLLTEAYMVKEKGKKEEGKKMVESSVATLKTTNNHSFLGYALFELSMYYNYQDSIECLRKIDLVNQAVAAFKKFPDYKGLGRALEMLGDLYIQIHNNSLAIQALKEAQVAYERIDYPRRQGVYVLLGTVYNEESDFGQALFYNLKALKIALALRDTTMQTCQIYNQLGRLYQEIGKFDLALTYLHNGLDIARKFNDGEAIYVIVSNMTASFHEINRSDQALKILSFMPRTYLTSDDNLDKYISNMCYLRAHNQLKQFDKSQYYLNIVLKLANEKLIPQSAICNTYKYAADYYAGTKQYSKARYYLAKSMGIVNALNLEYARIRGLRLAYELDSAQGNFRSANNYLTMYKAKTDSVYSERTARQFQVLSIEYELGMKEDSIKLKDHDILLLKRTNSLQQANLKQAQLIKNVTIIGIVLAAVIIGLLYRQFRNKQKSNRIITHKNDQLQHLLTEKEWLLREIHHRVKNNLQTVMSLLNSQSAYMDSDAARSAIHDSQHRVQAMSLIHQKLYNTENVSTIDMPVYIRELVAYLRDSFNTGQRIRFDFALDPLELDVSQAIPLGLILNEAITNSLKYAFPGDRGGVIGISLINSGGQSYELAISDNGIGIPAGFNTRKPGSLGISLMNGLSEDLEGKFEIENRNGTLLKISFRRDPGIKHTNLLASSFVPGKHIYASV